MLNYINFLTSFILSILPYCKSMCSIMLTHFYNSWWTFSMYWNQDSLYGYENPFIILLSPSSLNGSWLGMILVWYWLVILMILVLRYFLYQSFFRKKEYICTYIYMFDNTYVYIFYWFCSVPNNMFLRSCLSFHLSTCIYYLFEPMT